ncbi:hypothetical protein [Glycocaulis sp.]|uniref:hypothetical protein n=1 Tax=Glycocaulis sp. TaxID=1969725 RepID=UPI003F719BD4
MEAPTVLSSQIYYICGFPGSADGAQIFDHNLLAALAERGVMLVPQHPRRRRGLHPPFWQGRIVELPALISELCRARRSGARIVLSHEGFFGIAHRMPVDLLIVHNYMPCFSFPGQRPLELYYRTGSRAYFGRAFANAKAMVFVSHRDHRCAVADFPEIENRSLILPPPPQRVALGPGCADVIHMSGSEGWLPKRLSRLTPDEQAKITTAGLRIEDFGPHPGPSFGLIPDRFTVGFKLKLMQMLYVGDAIASLSEIGEEVRALAPEYTWWREVASVEEAVAWFAALRGDPAWQEHCAKPTRPRLPDWDGVAGMVEGMLKLEAMRRAIAADGQGA